MKKFFESCREITFGDLANYQRVKCRLVLDGSNEDCIFDAATMLAFQRAKSPAEVRRWIMADTWADRVNAQLEALETLSISMDDLGKWAGGQIADLTRRLSTAVESVGAQAECSIEDLVNEITGITKSASEKKKATS